MRIYTAVTDNDWFGFLAARPWIDEVNFWHPGGSAPFTNAEPGMPFLYKLKSPHHHIAGGGYFVKYETLPLRLAWEAFGEGNGTRSYDEFKRLINRSREAGDPEREIGCSMLRDPFYLPKDRWLHMRDGFTRNIVRGKFFDGSAGAEIWDYVSSAASLAPAAMAVAEKPPKWGAPRLVAPREGQGIFRAQVTNAYARRCAFTGETTLPVLEAAHIKPISKGGPNNTFNGLLLRSDFHKLFDIGLITVKPDLRIVVSDQIKDLYFNGKAYNRLNGERLISTPASESDRPRRDFLEWHNDTVYEREAANG